MSDVLIAQLQTQLTAQANEIAALKSEAKSRRQSGAKLQTELDARTKELATVTTERDGLKSKVDAKPGELQAENDALKGQIRTRDHRDAFQGVLADVAVKSKDAAGKDVENRYTLAPKASVETLWRETGYKPEGDAPDPAKIQGLVQASVESHPFLYALKAPDGAKTAPGGATNPITTPRGSAGPGHGKGVNDESRPSAVSQIDAAFGSRDPMRIA